MIIFEASTYQKKYKCPYCDKRFTRMDLVNHIDKKHSDMVPKDYTSTRVVFNMINKKDHGNCVMCGKETEWDEDKARYNRFCGSKSCHDKYVKIAHKNTGIEEKLRDPEFQQKMLANRSISGVYKFSDGGKVSYTGSYEKALLEFLDKVLNVKSEDVESPGPTIEYIYKGEKHFWITDQRYVPYDLVFDVKDGGDNPNNREMTEYREKQIAKEDAIRKQGKYNYIRLTNNNFQQLLEIMLELKEMLLDESKPNKPIIKINEDASITLGALPPANPNNVYIINYLKKNVFSGGEYEENRYALCKDYMQDAVTVKGGVFENINFEELQNADNVRVFKYINPSMDYIDILENSKEDTDFYKMLTGKDLLDNMQLEYDASFQEVLPYTEALKILRDSIYNTMNPRSPIVEGVSLPYFNLEQYNDCGDSNIKFYRDIDGVFLMNESSGMRTKSYGDTEFLEKFLSEISGLLY